jgi:two-component system, LytTR family, response regulator
MCADHLAIPSRALVSAGMTIRVIIADDEPPARRKLRRLLAAHTDVAIAGEASTGTETASLLASLRPDALFLDVQMPGLDGFEVLEALGDYDDMQVIFVTAYEDYALRAFEVNAFDYLLKPVSEERLAIALDRLRRSGCTRPHSVAPPHYWNRILVRGARAAYFVSASQIDWIEADRNYLVLHCGARAHLIRSTLEAFALRLDPAEFVRINRSTVVNLDRVRELRPRTHGEFSLLLKEGRELLCSRRYVSSALERFAP